MFLGSKGISEGGLRMPSWIERVAGEEKRARGDQGQTDVEAERCWCCAGW